ncbi:dynactin subunit 2 [Prorops nasuta]|uniref:dynactin subunit 2 n=1 Tax=Prorops nasuta TaxID=863751 RepID=UPI0034CE8ED0
MANPKYADLPGIAYDQSDVYETTDLPESEQQVYSEDENEIVERIRTTPSEAFNKFKDKNISSEHVDFSERITRKPRTGYQIFGCWETPGEGEKETPIQKLQRLQSEVKELYEEINEIKEKAKNKEEDKSTAEMILQVDSIGKQLNSLNLEEYLGADLLVSFSDPQGVRIKQLVSEIELFKNTVPTDEKLNLKQKTQSGKETEPGVLKYEMMYVPEKARMQEIARIAKLEQRICCLENIIGSGDDKIAKFSQNLKTQGIIEAVQQLGAKAALLDANQLDGIESRLSTLIHKMDNVVQKKSTLAQDSEQEQKITEMYETTKKVEMMSQILPQTVNRMVALNGIHQQAAGFAKTLTELAELQMQISTDLENNQGLLKGVQNSFATNLETIMNNLQSLDERVKKLKK